MAPSSPPGQPRQCWWCLRRIQTPTSQPRRCRCSRPPQGATQRSCPACSPLALLRRLSCTPGCGARSQRPAGRVASQVGCLRSAAVSNCCTDLSSSKVVGSSVWKLQCKKTLGPEPLDTHSLSVEATGVHRSRRHCLTCGWVTKGRLQPNVTSGRLLNLEKKRERAQGISPRGFPA